MRAMTPMLQTQAGTHVQASTRSQVQGAPKKFLLVLQYYQDDRDQAEALASLIADLERIRNKDIDLLVFSRSDAFPLSPDVISKLALKFNNVIQLRCTRREAKGYPFGSNAMFYELVTMFGQQPKWFTNYYAFLNLEPDCCPMGPGWLTRLIAEFRTAENEGFGCLGYIHDDPTRHMNGVAVYAIDIWRRVPGGGLSGGNPSIPYDIRQAKNLLPHAKHTDLMHFEYKKPTIGPEELFLNESTALYHGVKDESAREAVRSRFITFASDRDFSRKTVFTFYNPQNETSGDEKAMLALWRDGWTSRGWNPVVLRLVDAQKNGRYRSYSEAVDKFPFIGDKFSSTNRWLRWMALDTVSGGFYADLNVLPASFTPRALDGIVGFESFDGAFASLFFADKSATCAWIDKVLAYSLHDDDLQEGRPCVTDGTILSREITDNSAKVQVWVKNYGDPDYLTFRAVKFPGMKRRADMETFLKMT